MVTTYPPLHRMSVIPIAGTFHFPLIALAHYEMKAAIQTLSPKTLTTINKWRPRIPAPKSQIARGQYHRFWLFPHRRQQVRNMVGNCHFRIRSEFSKGNPLIAWGKNKSGTEAGQNDLTRQKRLTMTALTT